MTEARATTQQAIERLVEADQETGLQVAAYLHGELVVHACAGLADPASGRRVNARTLFNSWSAGKGLTSTVVHVLAELGLLDYDTPIGQYWPQFAAHGKQHVTVAHVFTHRGGVPQAPAGITPTQLADWDQMCARIADLGPLWEAGAATGYHALTFGYILGEVVRRVTGHPIARVLREQVAGPLGIADSLLFGVPAQQLARVARPEDGNWSTATAAQAAESLFFQAAPTRCRPAHSWATGPTTSWSTSPPPAP